MKTITVPRVEVVPEEGRTVSVVAVAGGSAADAHAGHNKRKSCCCGGHNWKNVKKNLHHHSTRKRLEYTRGRSGDNIRELSQPNNPAQTPEGQRPGGCL